MRGLIQSAPLACNIDNENYTDRSLRCAGPAKDGAGHQGGPWVVLLLLGLYAVLQGLMGEGRVAMAWASVGRSAGLQAAKVIAAMMFMPFV
jgi:hypothetical protein